MKDNCSSSKTRIALLTSIGANIFLIAFTLGRFSTPGFMPPPGMHGGPPPFAHHGDFIHPPGDHGGPPPFFGPDNFSSPEERQADEARMHADFEKMDVLRKAFAAQLEAGPVSKDDVLRHFADIDAIMGTVRKEAQDRAADKISAMSQEDRHKFAQDLLGKEGPPHL